MRIFLVLLLVASSCPQTLLARQTGSAPSPQPLVRRPEALGNPKYVIPALLIGTLGGDVVGAPDVRQASWRTLKSTALGGASTLILKSLIGRRRPPASPDDPYRFDPLGFKSNSLPSGHATTAFSLATSLAMEGGNRVFDVLLYGLAATTCFARVYGDNHWASDTFVGAGIGILAARFVQRHDRSGGVAVVTLSGSFTS